MRKKKTIYGLTEQEQDALRRLNTPRKIQDFLETLRANDGNDTCRSPRRVLQTKRAHCIEGAMLAALALRLQGHRPLIVDFESAPHDLDHVVTVYRRHGHWGAISKTNHVVLRFREPVYRSIRELALSYFHEYFDDDGRKTMRTFSRPVDLSRFDRRGWMTSDEDVWYVPEYLVDIPHTPILTRAQLAGLRRADPIEIAAGEAVQWKTDEY
ncbi:MAG TPA: hypothetical protein VN397_00740 [Candidatus Methylomirabilis sp.]|nr:hypothetical protein [Candidatus Methylomirabilis sp.]